MFDPEDFRRLASKMLQHRCDAAECRTAISRVYYASFLVAKQLLEFHFRFKKGPESHTQVQFALLNCNNQTAKELSRKLNDLRARRNDADYDINDTGVDVVENARLEEAKSSRIIKDLKQLFDPSTSAPLIQEIKSWAKASGKLEVR